MKKEQKKVLFEEAGKFFVDIAKYILTGVLITTLLQDYEKQKSAIYLIGIIISIAMFISGMVLLKNKEE